AANKLVPVVLRAPRGDTAPGAHAIVVQARSQDTGRVLEVREPASFYLPE
ncbi:cytochrome c oxidase accessory protein CcoG, partial [Bordetella pertussis]